jgi:hypothetical protein
MNSKTYWSLATAYGTGRAAYWLHQVNDTTITKDGVRYHPPTFINSLLFTVCSGVAAVGLWPLFMFSDISRYEKSKMGIREKDPPYPFNYFVWRDKK